MHACMASSTIFALFSILLFFFSPAASDAAANVLLLFKEQLRNTSALRSWGRGGRPCPGGSGRSWAGVVCLGSSVLGLHLEGMGLTAGAIDVELLASLPDLSAINFASNHLAGPMPAVSRLRGIKIVNLASNKFSGEISYQAFAGMASLEKLDLSSNQFSGAVPESLGMAAPNLKELHFENNRFTGGLPEFNQLELKAANFSNNRLEGPIPLPFLKFNISSFKGKIFFFSS